MIVISEDVLKHILRKHRDITRLMGIENVEELRKLITRAIKNPDETYVNTFGTKYFLKTD